MPRGEVTVGGNTFTVKPFHWPAPPLRIAVHPTLTGRLIEVDTTTRLQDVDIVLEGDEQEGWATMTDTMRTAIIALFQAGGAFAVSDWRGNSGTFFFLEEPQFNDIAAGEATPLSTFWGFRFRLGRIT